jgi:hypothetical protein
VAELPGAEIVDKGLADLRAGVESAEALLVEAFATRLRRAGVPVPELAPRAEWAELRLYRVLCAAQPAGAHGRYNALLRRMVSYARAAEALAPR